MVSALTTRPTADVERWAMRRPVAPVRVFEKPGHPGDRRYLVSEGDEPFFWLADTEWQLFWWTTESSARELLGLRARLGYTVVLATLLSYRTPIDSMPWWCGGLPFVDKDPAKPDLRGGYWDHVDYCLSLAEELGIQIGLLPTWGKYVNGPLAESGMAFTVESARAYGHFLGERYGARPNIIWVFGGDRAIDQGGEDKRHVYEAMVEGVLQAVSGAQGRVDCNDAASPVLKSCLKTYHPRGVMSSSQWFHDAPWLDFNMCQGGHHAKDIPEM